MAWSPDIYETFKEDRLAPLLELLARIPGRADASILDLGCGSGAAIAPLKKGWSEARITAVDNSSDMLSQLGARHPDVTCVNSDISAWVDDDTHSYDLILSNAALHWAGDHASIFPQLLQRINDSGALAIQMPNNWNEPSHTTMFELAKNERWQGKTNPASNPHPILDVKEYRRLLRPLSSGLNIWERTFKHRLNGQDAVLNWLMGSSLGVLIDPLAENEREEFCAELAPLLSEAYPTDKDGSTSFSFRRLFIIAEK